MSAKYNFDTNLLKASSSKNIDDAKKEWVILLKEKIKENALCICQRKVKIVTYLFNTKTHLTIIAGTTCCKKFNMTTENITNNLYSKILIDNLKKGSYLHIDNIVKYSDDIQKHLQDYFEEQHEIGSHNLHSAIKMGDKGSSIEYHYLNNLVNLRKKIDDLKRLYSLEYLNENITNIDSKIVDFKEKIANRKYRVVYYYNHYTRGNGRDTFKWEGIFSSIEECKEWIKNKLCEYPLNKIIYHYNDEITGKYIEIFYNDEIIEKIN
jgi:hypothetical protein